MNESLKQNFIQEYNRGAEYIFSAPGRTELGGNHTDHQLGKVLAGSVNLDIKAAVARHDGAYISLVSQGYAPCRIELNELEPKEAELGTSAALIRGIAAGIKAKGHELCGFDAYLSSSVLPGSGLSSSAAFEVLVGTIINQLSHCGLDPVELAMLGQYAENRYFGKPCGLMDQMACSVGNIVAIDFKDRDKPLIQPVDFDFSSCGYALCIINSGADHADLTDEYAAIPGELLALCRELGCTSLRQADEGEFYSSISRLRKAVGDRAVLRAMHVFEENRRVDAQVQTLKDKDFDSFLRLVSLSGRSSWMYLQNVIPSGNIKRQELAFSLALTEKLLSGRGAFRVHGGGFAGTIQAYVPLDMLDSFQAEIDRVLGAGSCQALSIRPQGGMLLEAL